MAGYKAQGNSTCTYNSNALTNYINQADVASTLAQIDVTTLGDSGKVNIVDAAEWSINIGGPWHPTLDGFLAPDAVTPGTKRTAVIAYTNGASTVTYTWTANAEVGNWNITSAPGGAITWSATLTLSGAPVRTVA
ncbi:MAG: hypothetical protein IPL15_11355 [Comamonadaceae bacterium]|uniref:hypothetical protein n=1 Tax=Candidatus Skiveiella danica TaxID=3386177 RepID=UPI00390AAE8B|nr:hypothetical protein [Comamonadaceae bacterium]